MAEETYARANMEGRDGGNKSVLMEWQQIKSRQSWGSGVEVWKFMFHWRRMRVSRWLNSKQENRLMIASFQSQAWTFDEENGGLSGVQTPFQQTILILPNI